MEIEWDPEKARSNRAKHRVELEEAVTCLLDSNALVLEDEESADESRWILVGMSTKPRLLTIVYTLRMEDRIRLISARKATRREARDYA